MSSEITRESVDVYIFHSIEDVVVGFYLGDNLLNYRKIPKTDIGEQWVESFKAVMNKTKIDLQHIKGIYLSSSFSTWNASRLITLFAKTMSTFSGIALYLREESQDKLDIDDSLKSFHRDRKNFRFVEDALTVAPIYKKCQGINT